MCETENVELIFIQDTIEKKKTARGIHNRASRTGRIGKMMTPIDFMGAEEKRNYTKGKLRIYYMDDLSKMLTKDKFLMLDKEERTRLVREYLENYSNDEIMEGMGTKPQFIYDQARACGVDIKTVNRKKVTPPSERRKIGTEKARKEVALGKEDNKVSVNQKQQTFSDIDLRLVAKGSIFSEMMLGLLSTMDKDKTYTIMFNLNEVK